MDSNQPRLTDGIEATGWMFWKRRRHIVAFLAFFGFFNVYSLRVNLSVGIVAMTQEYSVTNENGTYMKQDFDWDSKTQGVILSSFFYGYMCTQLFGGWIGARLGGAKVYGFGIAVTAFLTAITPPIVRYSTSLFIAVRIFEGLFEGVTYPCMHAVWAKWAPPSERARLASFAFSGSYAGTVVALPLSGLLANKLGWPYIFYVTGLIGICWCIIWWMVVKDNPEDDPYISPEELKYLHDTLGNDDLTKIDRPWKAIFTSLPLWAIVVAHFCENWGFYTLLTQLPTFMKDALNFDLKDAGFLSSLPYLVMGITLQFAGRLADYLNNNGYLSTTNVRKAFNCGAFIAQTIFMSLAGHILTPAGVVTCLVLAVGFGAFAWPGFSINHLDIAPQHASILMGITNTFATLPGIVSPILTGYIVDHKTPEEWKLVFYIGSGIYLVGAVFYALFASGERQPWAMTSPEPSKTNQDISINHMYDNKGIEIDNSDKAMNNKV